MSISTFVKSIVASPEQSLAMPTTGGTSQSIAVTTILFDFMQFTNPNAYDFVRISAVQWKNFATIAGNIQVGIYIIDSNPAVSANMELVALVAFTAQAGINSLQKASVVWSKAFSGTPILGVGLIPSNATATFSGKAAQPSQNRSKTITAPTTHLPPFDSTAWAAGTVYLADITLFYVGYK